MIMTLNSLNLCVSLLIFGLARTVSDVNLLERDAKSGVYNNHFIISRLSKSVCVHSLNFTADYFGSRSQTYFGRFLIWFFSRFFCGRVSQM